MTAATQHSDEPTLFGPGARVGDVIAGRYRVLREIGAGGMGQVVEVEHLELEKRFALKLIRPDRWDEALETRFRREAKALARVDSPRVAQVTDFGVEPDLGPFYVMELVQGRSLDTVIREEGPLSREHALELATGIAEALVDVHDAGLVHRDIKPSNIGVCERGPVPIRLLDFGLATAMDDQLGSRLTDSRRVIGSFPYMAPEQFHGEPPTPHIDVWALGVVLYEMLSAELPFAAPSTAALIQQILAAEVPMRHPAPRVCAPLLRRMLAKAPADRPADAGAALILLEEALTQPPTEVLSALNGAETAEATVVVSESSPTAAPGPRVRLIGGMALGLVGLAAMAGAWQLTRTRGPAAEAPPVERAAEGTIETASAPHVAQAPEAPTEREDHEPPQNAERAAEHEAEPAAPRRRTRRQPNRSPRPAVAQASAPNTESPAAEPSDTEPSSTGAPTDEPTTDEPTTDESRTPRAPEPPPEAPSPSPPEAPAWTGDIIEAPSP